MERNKFNNIPSWLFSLLFILIICIIFPYIIQSHYLRGIAVNIIIFSIVALGLQLIMGYSGQISLGQAAFVGVGAYTAAILLKAGLTFWLVLPVSGLIAGIIGFIMSPIVRLKGIYFAIATLAFNIVLSNIFNSWDSVTGGVGGIINIPQPSLGNLALSTPYHYFIISVIILWVFFQISNQIINSGYGRSLRSIRDNDIGALSAGINVLSHKMQIIFVGCFFAGVAGSIMASYRGFVSPEPFNMHQSFFIVSMLVVGGLNNLKGVVIGAAVMTFVSEYISIFAGQHRVLVNGIILLLFILFLPNGLMGIYNWFILKINGFTNKNLNN